MKTEYASTLTKDFDLTALAEIRLAAFKRAEWCRDEAKRRHKDHAWGLTDALELMEDANEFSQLAYALDAIIKS